MNINLLAAGLDENLAQIVEKLKGLIDSFWLYIVIALAAVVVIWGAYIGIKIAIAHRNEEKINARDMVKNLIIGIVIIFVVAMGAPLLINFLWLLQLIDGLMEIFSAISGVATVNYHEQQVNIVEFIVGDSTIGAVFWCIFITAVGLTCIFTIVGLVKNMIANNRNVSTIVGKFFLALLGAMAMLAVVILGILIANSFLQLLARIFQVNSTTKLSTAIFNACVGEWLNGYSASNIDVTSLRIEY